MRGKNAGGVDKSGKKRSNSKLPGLLLQSKNDFSWVILPIGTVFTLKRNKMNCVRLKCTPFLSSCGLFEKVAVLNDEN